MKVSATAKGFDGKSIRVPGDTFDMPDGSRSPWFVPVSEGDEFTESDINAEVQRIVDARAATVLAADRTSAIANLVVRRTVSADINTAVANAAALKLTAENAVKDAQGQSSSASTAAQHEAAAVAVAKAKASLAAAEGAVVTANANHDAFVGDNYPARSVSSVKAKV